MNTLPPLIIVTDRGRLLAYRSDENQHLEVIDTLEIAEGLEKLSDLVTDNAGRFPNSGSPQHEGGSAERMPLIAELEMRAFAKIVQRITELCEQHRPHHWAFAAPSEINSAILDGLDPRWKNKITVNFDLDLVHEPAKNLVKRLLAETAVA